MVKTLLGLVGLVVLGFIVFVTLSAFGFVAAVIVSTYAWWQIALGTVFGMIIVIVHLWEDGKNK